MFVWPPDARGVARWLFGVPGFLAPWTVAYIALAIVVWRFATPGLESMRSWSAGWVGAILVRNLVLALAWCGVVNVALYVRCTQRTDFKYDQRWPGTSSRRHTFGSQLRDNLFWSLGSGVPIRTAWECLTLWMASNGRLPTHAWATHPVWFVVLVFLIPIFREIHFYVVHRAIHHPAVYRRVHAHYLHHTLFEVNYADGVIPLDRWFGTFHDGTPAADERTMARRRSRLATAGMLRPDRGEKRRTRVVSSRSRVGGVEGGT